jgi:hypothetical protein
LLRSTFLAQANHRQQQMQPNGSLRGMVRKPEMIN